ncbi:hypothetical protein RRG08_023949 [Elysia crispata]|uniref:Uncharacterized protein n=1 Tax=Elysia crispata TaxID=231223 RepID=A0AAE0YM79_9GAST|nr:hypothetical protein RRG08_023949 [Elysia crispata]
MRPNKRELRRPKLTPFINRNDDWKYCPSEPLSPSLARPDGRKAINVTDFDIGKGRHHYYNSALRDVLYLDASRQQSSRKGMNDDDVRGADNSAEKPHGNINTKNWIFQHTFSKHSAPHDKESLEYLIGTSHQVTKSHFYHKPGSIIVNGRYSSEYELFKRRKSKDFEHLNTQSKTSKIHYPTSESSPQVEDKYFDNNDRYRKKSRKRSSQEYSAEELESNPTPKIE